MEAKGFVVPPGQGRAWEMAAGRSSALKLLGGETGDSVMMFEETAPAGTQTTYHLHHDSDEVAYVLAVMGGSAVFSGTSVLVQTLLDYLEATCPVPGLGAS